MSDFKNILMDGFEEPTDKVIRGPFKWPGSKYKTVKKLVPKLPRKKRFVDVFGGTGTVLINMPKHQTEIFNDRNGGIAALYRCIQNKELLKDLCERIDYSINGRELFIELEGTYKDCIGTVEKAFRFIYCQQYSFGGIGQDWGRNTKTTSSLGGLLRKKIPNFHEIHKRIQDVVLENDSFERIIKNYSNKDTLLYLDPPYPESKQTTYAEHKMQPYQYNMMLDLIFKTDSTFALSGYSNDLFENQDWDERYEFESAITINAMGGDNQKNTYIPLAKRTTNVECLWIKH